MMDLHPHVKSPLSRQVLRSYAYVDASYNNSNTNLICISKEYPDPASQADNSLHVDRSPTVQPKAGKKSAKTEPYSAPRALELFSTYTDSDDPTIIGPEGFEQLCTDAGIPMDGSCPLILAWLMEAKEMAKISKSEWTAGTSTLKYVMSGQLCILFLNLSTILLQNIISCIIDAGCNRARNRANRGKGTSKGSVEERPGLRPGNILLSRLQSKVRIPETVSVLLRPCQA